MRHSGVTSYLDGERHKVGFSFFLMRLSELDLEEADAELKDFWTHQTIGYPVQDIFHVKNELK